MDTALTSIFDFILLKLASIYIKRKQGIATSNIETLVKVFNSYNDFDQTKINLFPYIITMGNGHKKELLEFFKDGFFYTPFGLFQKEFYSISRKGSTNNLEFDFTSSSISITLKNTLSKNSISNEIENNELFETVLLKFFSSHNEHKVLEYINKSINSIDSKYPNHFITGTHQDLLNLNRVNTGFILLENAMRKDNLDFKQKKRLEDTFNDKVKYERSRLEFA